MALHWSWSAYSCATAHEKSPTWISVTDFSHVPSDSASSPYTPSIFSCLTLALVPFWKWHRLRGQKCYVQVSSVRKGPHTHSPVVMKCFIPGGYDSCHDTIWKTVSNDIKGKYEGPVPGDVLGVTQRWCSCGGPNWLFGQPHLKQVSTIITASKAYTVCFLL